ncbi:MAG: hypothetical protein HOO67_01285 [Candidatus Peribacteraceae bacterium]|nr:hypothetical protein [Candidatus Peribacteraceae bacterium]
MTLPKKFRDAFPTVHFMATQVDGGVLLKPIREEIEYWEKPDGSSGLHFPYGIDAGKLADMFDEANRRIDADEKKKKPSRKKRHG